MRRLRALFGSIVTPLLLLGAAPAFEPLLAGPLAVGAWALWRFAARHRARERQWVASTLFALSAAASAGLTLGAAWDLLDSAHRKERPEALYGVLWADLERFARAASSSLTALPLADPGQRLELFDRLERVSRASEEPRSLLLIDPYGDVVAWSGRGLLHDPRPPFGGSPLGFAQSALSATLWVALPVEPAASSWTLVAGQSFERGAVPPTLLGDRDRFRVESWRIEADAATGRPLLRVLGAVDALPPIDTVCLARAALLLFALGLAALAAITVRARRLELAATPAPGVAAEPILLGAAAIAFGLAGSGASPSESALAAGSFLVAGWAWSRGEHRPLPTWAAGAVAGSVGPALIAVAAFLPVRSAEVAETLLAGSSESALRLVALFVVLAALLVRGVRGGNSRGLGAGAGAAALLAAASTALPGGLLFQLVLLAGAGLSAARGLARGGRTRAGTLAATAALAALIAGAGWNVGQMTRARRDASERIAELVPPSPVSVRALVGAIESDLAAIGT